MQDGAEDGVSNKDRQMVFEDEALFHCSLRLPRKLERPQMKDLQSSTEEMRVVKKARADSESIL